MLDIRGKARRLAILGILFFGAVAGFQGQSSDSRFLIVLDDQTLTDAERASLVTLIIQATDPTNWPKVRPRPGSAIATVVDDFFDYDPEASSATVKALGEAIRSANANLSRKLRTGEEIAIPPIPVKGYEDFREKRAAIRTFDTATMGYEHPSSSSKLIFSDESRTEPVVKGADDRHKSSLTFLRMDLTPKTLQLIASIRKEFGGRPVLVMSESRRAKVRLLDAPDGCPAGSDWLPQSPYWPLAAARLNDKTRQDMYQKATKDGLTIVDWGFQARPGAKAGHGRAVLAVAQYLLSSQLKLSGLVSKIKPLDLDPVVGKVRIQSALKDYKPVFQKRTQFSDTAVGALFSSAEMSLETPGEPTSGHEVSIEEMVMRAVLWSAVTTSAWVNLSFTVDSPVMDPLPAELLSPPESFIVAASGNSADDLWQGSVPQVKVPLFGNLINVTYGSTAGGVWGTANTKGDAVLVNLLAPGCGYNVPELKNSDAGSSLASPYVATAAWVKHLLDGVVPDTMRETLIEASTPVLNQEKLVESGGVFDAAKLLSGISHHLLGKDRRIVPLSALNGIVEYRDDETSNIINANIALGDGPLRTMAIRSCGDGQWCIWLRSIRAGAVPSAEVHTGVVTRLQLLARSKDGSVIPIGSANLFAASFESLWY